MSLKKFTQIKSYKHWIKLGKDSGYPPCCIATFLVRMFAIEVNFKINGGYPKWCLSPTEKGRQHIVCPYHKLTIKQYVYHTCDKCGWHQYNDPDCKNCAQSDIHGRYLK